MTNAVVSYTPFQCPINIRKSWRNSIGDADNSDGKPALQADIYATPEQCDKRFFVSFSYKPSNLVSCIYAESLRLQADNLTQAASVFKLEGAHAEYPTALVLNMTSPRRGNDEKEAVLKKPFPQRAPQLRSIGGKNAATSAAGSSWRNLEMEWSPRPKG